MKVFGRICLILLIIVILELFYVYNIGAETGTAAFKKLLAFIIIDIFIAPPIIFIAMSLK